MPRCRLVLAIALSCSTVIGGVGASAQAPRISKPRPVGDTPSTMAPLPPAVIDDKLEIGGDAVDARVVETRMTVETHVNGRGPYHFVVDSGADTSVVGLRIAYDLQLPLGTPVILNAMTDRSIVDRVKVDSLTLGPSTVHDLELPALREQDLGGDGMIGIDALVKQRLMMDFDERVIKVEDASKRHRPLPDEIVVIGRLNKGQLILTQVRAGGVSLEAVIDTGSSISIGNSALRDKLIRRGRFKDWTVATTGVTGRTVDLQLALIRELRIGSVTLQNVPIAFADLPPFEVFGIADQPALLLGTDVLEMFRKVSLDFKARKARFQLRRCRGIATVASASVYAVTTRFSGSGATCGR